MNDDAPWPPTLGDAATPALRSAFYGFDGAAARLAQAMTDLSHVPAREHGAVVVNAELSTLLWFARSTVEHCRQEWPGGWAAFDALVTAEGREDVLLAWRWARDHAGHALARPAGLQEGGVSFPLRLPMRFPDSRWVWMARCDLPSPRGSAAARRSVREDGRRYDAALAGQDVQASVQVMAGVLTDLDRRLADSTR